MKKIILMLLVMFSFIVVNAEETVDVRLQWVPNVYYNYEKDGLNYWGQFAYIYAGDKIAYCLDISKTINSPTYTKSDEIQSNNLVTLSGYFGYGYDENMDLKDYMATQKLIWQFLGTEVYFTTKSNGLGEKIDISSNESRIRLKINNHATFPAYDSNFNFIIGSTNNLIQKNNINNGYNILNNTNNIIEFSKEGLLFSANEIGKNSFYLETKYMKNFDNQIYVADNSQKIMVIGGIENLLREYTYEVIGGTLNLKVIFDKNINGASLSDNVFEVYDDGGLLVGSYIPDNNGNIMIENLGIGKYKIKHIKVSDGYKVTSDEYAFEITEESLNQTIEVNLKLKTINVVINKTFSNPLINILNYDSGVVYKIYDSDNNLIKECVIDEMGYTIFELEYGDYRIVQSSINNIDIYHEDILISKDMFEENLVFNIHDDIYQAKIKVIVLDKTSQVPIENLNFMIDEKESVTNENGIFISDILNFGIYKFSNINMEGYYELENFEYMLSENNNFYVENNEAYVDLLLYLEKIEVEDLNNQDNEDTKLEEPENNEEDKEQESNPKDDSSDNENLGQDDIVDDKNTEDSNPKDTISNEEEKDNNLEEIISNEEVKDDNSDESISKEEKLPFLGESENYDEDTKIYNFIDYLFRYICVFYL